MDVLDSVRATVPASGGYAVTPSDDDDLPRKTRALYIGTAGALKVTMVNDEVVAFSGLLAGSIYPLAVKRVWDTGTDADGIVALT